MACALARSRGLGILITRQVRVFSQDDLAAMRERKTGRPRKPRQNGETAA